MRNLLRDTLTASGIVTLIVLGGVLTELGDGLQPVSVKGLPDLVDVVTHVYRNRPDYSGLSAEGLRRHLGDSNVERFRTLKPEYGVTLEPTADSRAVVAKIPVAVCPNEYRRWRIEAHPAVKILSCGGGVVTGGMLAVRFY